MKRIAATTFLLASTAALALAGTVTAPEIDASAAVAAVTLLAGGLLVLRSRRRS